MVYSRNDFLKVFYLSSHGMGGDHWFDWLAKALNAHQDVLVFLGESVRSKYLKERSRKERPDIVQYTFYLNDVGSRCYEAVGECFSYRAYQLEVLSKNGLDVRWANIVRHPYAWLYFYIKWRTSNMNMPEDNISGVDHEWSVTKHEEFAKLPLKKYRREDVHVWSAYQGMDILNRMASDLHKGVINIPLEDLIYNREKFLDLVHYLFRNRVKYSEDLLDKIYSMVDTPFRGEEALLTDPQKEYESWPKWKKDAFEVIVNNNTKKMFESYGYEL
ncbi:MAG: hypothetical protein ACD_19C00170G0002 [uncultured bacterium]|nr:MAG: hypothetical protein ACD_19C00170G0002 [uncultured bacterium]